MVRIGTGWKVDGSGYGYGFVNGSRNPTPTRPPGSAQRPVPPSMPPGRPSTSPTTPRRRSGPGAALAVVLLVTVLAGAGYLVARSRSSNHAATHAVPNVVGLDSAHAAEVLSTAGFTPSSVDLAAPPAEFGHVVRTDPAPGLREDRGGTVIMYIAVVPVGS